MAKRAFTFPGQGSQAVGMGKDLAAAYPAAKAVFDEVDAALGQKLSQVMFEGPDETLRLTANAQPALMAVSMAVVRVLESRGVRIADAASYVAGHSLGDDAEQGDICGVANDNAPGQVVISGHAGAVARAIELLKAAGAKRALPLPVSAPFHCALMRPAADAMEHALAAVAFEAPSVPVVVNVTARPTSDPAAIKAHLVEQVTGMVRWTESIQWLAGEGGVTEFYELGAGKVLTGLAKRIAPDAAASAVGTPADIEAALAALSA